MEAIKAAMIGALTAGLLIFVPFMWMESGPVMVERSPERETSQIPEPVQIVDLREPQSVALEPHRDQVLDVILSEIRLLTFQAPLLREESYRMAGVIRQDLEHIWRQAPEETTRVYREVLESIRRIPDNFGEGRPTPPNGDAARSYPDEIQLQPYLRRPLDMHHVRRMEAGMIHPRNMLVK